MWRWAGVCLLVVAGGRGVVATAEMDRDNAGDRALMEGRAADATRILEASVAADGRDARAHLLLCRVFLSEELPGRAVPECETAVALDPGSSEAELWMGRAYGAKAATANPLAAFPLARKVRAAFERAVELDGKNGAAMSDLGQFYVEAPAIVGGGVDKARVLAGRMEGMPARMHRLLAQAAEKAGDMRTAEREYRDAGGSAGALVDLAQFEVKRGRPDEALAAVRAAVAADRGHGPEMVDAAAILAQANRAPELRVQMLRQYLRSADRTDAAPAFRVRDTLGDLLRSEGDTRGADAEYAAARALAPEYAAARR